MDSQIGLRETGVEETARAPVNVFTHEIDRLIQSADPDCSIPCSKVNISSSVEGKLKYY